MELLPALLASGVMAALVTGLLDLLKSRLARKDAKEDKSDAIMGELVKISNKLDKHIEQDEIDKISDARQRILRFADEETRGHTHGKEMWSSCMEDIDNYEDYCRLHPLYPNSKATISINYLKTRYAEKLETNNFNV